MMLSMISNPTMPDVNGFHLGLGDLVEATRALGLAERIQGIVVAVCQPTQQVQVKLERMILPTSEEPERILALSTCWKLIAKGIDE